MKFTILTYPDLHTIITQSTNALTSTTATPFWTKVNQSNTYDNLKQTNTTTYNGYDNYGNLTGTQTGISSSGFLHTSSQLSYSAIGIRGIPNMPTNVESWSNKNGDSYISRTDYEYFSNGNLKKQTIFADKAQPLATTYTYNAFGNVTRTEANAPNDATLAARYKTYTYDSKGRMPISEGNTLGQTTYSTAETDIDWRYGNPLKRTLLGVAGDYTFTYDAFGRGKTTTSPEGITATTKFNWDIRTGGINEEAAPDNAVFYVEKTVSNHTNFQKTWCDLLGRPRASKTQSFTGDPLMTVNTYDERGNLHIKTLPFFEGSYPNTTEGRIVYEYDALNRPVSATDGRGTATIAYTYTTDNSITTTTDYAGVTKTAYKDKTGALVMSQDQGGDIVYQYNASNQPVKIINGTNIASENSYDEYHRQISTTEPNAGTYKYEYNAYGELIKQIDNAGNEYQLQYDDAGRVTVRTNPATGETTEYAYVQNGTNGVNELQAVTCSNGITDEFEYDDYSRLKYLVLISLEKKGRILC